MKYAVSLVLFTLLFSCASTTVTVNRSDSKKVVFKKGSVSFTDSTTTKNGSTRQSRVTIYR